MKAIHILRKPCSEPTVAANVLRHGTGAINVDGCRVQGGGAVHAVQSDPGKRTGTVGTDLGFTRQDVDTFRAAQAASIERTNTLGRWPANVLFTHAPGCVRAGSRKVKGQNPKYANEGRGAGKGEGVYESGVGPRPAGIGIGYADAEGKETIAAYDCAPGCPVAALDEQTESLTRQGSPKKVDTGDKSFLGTGHGGAANSTFYGDTGGASRFFKQFGGESA